MRLIQEIGSYAGLAAIPGLAILSALYFSQARDVRRLRDWAGRAPERASEHAQGGRVLPRPATQAGVGAVQPAQPAAQPVARPAAAAATGAAVGAAASSAAGSAASSAAGSAAGGGGGTATATRPTAGPPGTHPPVPRVPVSGQTSVLPTPSPNGGDPWYRRATDRLPAARYIAIVLVGILVVGGGIAYGVTQLNKSSSSPTPSSASGGAATQGKAAKKKKQQPKPAPAINPASVKVTVENGTGVTGLAHSYGTKLQQDGFNVINQLTSTQSGVAESVVEFRPGKSSEAALVRRKLGIAQIQPADSTRLSQSGGSDVIVLLGGDLANKPAP